MKGHVMAGHGTDFDLHAASSCRRVSILIVDDDPDCRLLVREAIESGGLVGQVIECGSGEAALAKLRELADAGELPTLVFLDIELPGIDGIETLRRIRGDDRLRAVPVVILSGVAEESTIRKASESGANSYTIKPVDASRFFQNVIRSADYWLSVHQQPGRHVSQEMARRAAPDFCQPAI